MFEARHTTVLRGARCWAVLALLCLAAAGTRADNLYLGAGAYYTDIQAAAFDDSDIVPAGFIGYQFLDSNLLMLSVEGGYYDLGSVSGSASGTAFSADASALTLSGVAYLPIGPFVEVYGKLGVAAMRVDTRFGDLSRDDDETAAFAGAGVALDFLDTIDLYVEYLQFDNAIDSKMIGVGIRLDFF